MQPGPIEHYLKNYAEPLEQHLQIERIQPFDCALVIPLYDEAVDCLEQTLTLAASAACLVIAVVNAPDDAPADALTRSHDLLLHLAQRQASNLQVVDCLTQRLDARAGVGLARKIGTDLALALYAEGQINSPWIYQTDADAILPANYFHAELPALGAVVFDHHHVSAAPQLAQAAAMYETHMAYYVHGLTLAGSKYAYPALGSTIVIHAQSYAAVRGYPKRNAGEDFYLLNKVAKIHGVTHLSDIQITLAARVSNRVPFGTGPALEKIQHELQSDPSGGSYMSYHLDSFGLLQTAHNYLNNFANDRNAKANATSDLVSRFLDELRFDKVRDSVRKQYPQPQRRLEILQQWFDAGKTLRFIHQARAINPDQPLLETLPKLPVRLQKLWPQQRKM